MNGAVSSPRRPGRIHAARLDTSPRLQAVRDALLPRGKRLSTRALIEATGYVAIPAIAAELRANGVPVVCRPSGRIYYYWIEDTP
ncbi:MAG: hypothetical protein OXB97_04530 [Rhodospirillales bacterium]|nr:hypothetical protein [Rhodospirillales bacterium]